jgi:hypothetical protein
VEPLAVPDPQPVGPDGQGLDVEWIAAGRGRHRLGFAATGGESIEAAAKCTEPESSLAPSHPADVPDGQGSDGARLAGLEQDTASSDDGKACGGGRQEPFCVALETPHHLIGQAMVAPEPADSFPLAV